MVLGIALGMLPMVSTEQAIFLAVNNMGASIGAVAGAVYPAIGTVLAFLFLKEKVKWYQWIFLIFTLLGVYGLSYSPSINIENFRLGLLGAFMCAFS